MVLYDHENSVIIEVNVPNIQQVRIHLCREILIVMKKVTVTMRQMRYVRQDEEMAVQ